MNTKIVMGFYLAVMASLIAGALAFPATAAIILNRPDLYLHAKFFHIFAVTLFFAQVVLGTIWETRSLWNGQPEIIRYTYDTVAWMDAFINAPLILVSVISGVMMGTTLGGVLTIGWLSVAFILFLASGLIWVVADIPMQYQLNRLFRSVESGARVLPRRLKKLLMIRVAINVLCIFPLLFIFVLMVHKPNMGKVAGWFGSPDSISKR